MSNVLRVVMLASLLAFAGLLGGCSSKPKMGAYNIQVSLDPALAGAPAVPSIEVDIVGVPDARRALWNAQSLNAYFSAANADRHAADKHTMNFGSGQVAPQTLARNAAIWKTWLDGGATQVYIMASLPGVSTDAPGDMDPRRLILPLDTRQWDRGQTIEIEVQANRLVPRTAPKPLPAN